MHPTFARLYLMLRPFRRMPPPLSDHLRRDVGMPELGCAQLPIVSRAWWPK